MRILVSVEGEDMRMLSLTFRNIIIFPEIPIEKKQEIIEKRIMGQGLYSKLCKLLFKLFRADIHVDNELNIHVVKKGVKSRVELIYTKRTGWMLEHAIKYENDKKVWEATIEYH